MNNGDREYFEEKFNHFDKRLDKVHDDVLIIKTERKMEKKLTAAIAGGISLAVSIIAGIFWR